jgi:hypothetical protein
VYFFSKHKLTALWLPYLMESHGVPRASWSMFLYKKK